MLVGGHLQRQIHQLGLVGAGELGVAQVAEHEVVHLVEEHAAQVLRLGEEGVDVDVQVEAPSKSETAMRAIEGSATGARRASTAA